jgi:hypothetical protein
MVQRAVNATPTILVWAVPCAHSVKMEANATRRSLVTAPAPVQLASLALCVTSVIVATLALDAMFVHPVCKEYATTVSAAMANVTAMMVGLVFCAINAMLATMAVPVTLVLLVVSMELVMTVQLGLVSVSVPLAGKARCATS